MKKLVVKDLISIGVASAIYFVVFIAISMLGMIPIMSLLTPAIAGLILALPFMLLVLRTAKFGAVSLMGLVGGLIFFAMGQGIHLLITLIVLGLLADLILYGSKYKSRTAVVVAYIVFNIWQIVTLLPMWLAVDKAVGELEKAYGAAFATEISSFLTTPGLIGFVIVSLLGSFLGALLGLRIMRKHFARANMI